MAEWREFNASNEPETCLWCGRKLRWRKDPVFEGTLAAARGGKPKTVNAYDRPGDYGDGFFCGLRCAHQFATTLAEAGRRLQPRGER